jgi:alkaline phosphatase D
VPDIRDIGLTDMVAVGATDHDSVRLWLRSKAPGAHHLELWPEGHDGQCRSAAFQVDGNSGKDNTHTLRYPQDFAGALPLEPLARYRFQIVRGGDREMVGSGGFETAPPTIDAAPERFSLAFMSCHQPLSDDGELRPQSLRLLRALPEACAQFDVKRLLFMGDQMYADYPPRLSLFNEKYFSSIAPEGRRSILDCSAEEVRRLYQERYRAFWNIAPFQALQSNFSTYHVLDDHEIVDNFGTDPEHATEKWQSLRSGALAAYDDYQSGRMRSRDSAATGRHFTFTYGPLAAFVMDLRSQRHSNARRTQLYGDDQHRELRAFLERESARPFVAIVLSVPLVHIPDWLADLAGNLSAGAQDAADRWSFSKSLASRERFVRLLQAHQRRHPEQKVLLLGGDIHTGVASRITWERGGGELIQLVSSALSNCEGAIHRAVAGCLPRLASGLTTGRAASRCRVQLLHGSGKNPYSGLNAGIVEFRRDAGVWSAKMHLVSHDDSDPPRAKVVFSADI